MSEENKRLEPLSDSVFNYLFSDKGMKGSMREIINCVLSDAGDTEIGEVQEITTQYDVKKRGFGAHGGRVDVRARTADGTLFDVEVQLSAEPAMNARSWFYGSGIMGEEFREGMPYGQVANQVGVCEGARGSHGCVSDLQHRAAEIPCREPYTGEREGRPSEELAVHAGQGL